MKPVRQIHLQWDLHYNSLVREGKWCAADDWTSLTDNFKLKFSDVWMSPTEGTLCDTNAWEREE